MKRLAVLLTEIAGISLLFHFSAVAAPIFEPESHCVAYQAHKVMFLVRSVEVIGHNCKVSSQVIPEVGGKFYFELRIPAGSFESGETKRDQDVYKVLQAKSHPDMFYKTPSRTQEEWVELLKKKTFVLEGQLSIAGRKHQVAATVSMSEEADGVVALGEIRTNFEHLGLKPPAMGMGLLARVKNNMALHFRLRADKTLGMDSILVP